MNRATCSEDPGGTKQVELTLQFLRKQSTLQEQRMDGEEMHVFAGGGRGL